MKNYGEYRYVITGIHWTVQLHEKTSSWEGTETGRGEENEAEGKKEREVTRPVEKHQL